MRDERAGCEPVDESTDGRTSSTEANAGVLILGGGEATRLPGKLELGAGPVPMLVRVFENLSPGRETWLAGKGSLAPALDALLPAPLAVDRWSLRGPLAGLVTTMARMRARWVFAVAGDAPLVESAFIDRLVAERMPGDEAVVPIHDRDGKRQPEPLAALYDRLAFLREAFPIAAPRRRRAASGARPPANALRRDRRSAHLHQRKHGRGLRGAARADRNRRPMSSSNADAFARAQRVIPGGVNSPVRAFKAVGGTPFFVAYADGCELVDVEGKRYIDYVMSWGPLILGHAHPAVVAAVRSAAERGTSYGAPTEAESELAELVCALVPSIAKVRFCSSGTEATMSALRLARAFTKRAKVIKFAGCYHGHADAFLISAG